MRLSLLRFNDMMVTVPGGRMTGADLASDICESSFRAADGWEIHRVSQGVFTLRAEHMPSAYTVESAECGYFPAPIEPVDTEAPVTVPAKKAKR